MKTLVIGVGNPGRRDDGLGPALVLRLAGTQPPERAIADIALSLFSIVERGQFKENGVASRPAAPIAGIPPVSPQTHEKYDTVEAFWTYQLNIEDAATVGDYDRVVFADAAADETETGDARRERRISPTLPPDAVLESLSPAASIAFTTHEMSPASVLALAEELYGKAPAGFLLKIRGAEWDFVEGLSAEGGRCLNEAERVLRDFLGSSLQA